MHEMALTQSIIDIIVEEAAKNGASRITRADIVLGEMSGAVDHCIEFNFEYLSRNTPAEGAKLNFINIPKQARCLECGHEFYPGGTLWTCETCNSLKLEIISGNELYIKSIEVE